jgi:hypothetical protein
VATPTNPANAADVDPTLIDPAFASMFDDTNREWWRTLDPQEQDAYHSVLACMHEQRLERDDFNWRLKRMRVIVSRSRRRTAAGMRLTRT